MVVDMGLIRMGGHHKLVSAAGELHRQFVSNPVRLLRSNFIRLEGLDDPIHDNIPFLRLAPSGNLVVKLLTDFKFLGG